MSTGFNFQPVGGTVRGPAYSRPFKALAVAMVGLIMAWGVQLWSHGQLVLTLRSGSWVLAAVALLLLTEWHILRGTTTLDCAGLQQTWVWHKRIAFSDLAYAKLVRVQGLEWLFAPRLYTRTFSNKLTVFYAASPQLLNELQRLAQELDAARTSA